MAELVLVSKPFAPLVRETSGDISRKGVTA